MRYLQWVILFIISALALSSCYTSKNVVYFQDLTDTAKIYSQVIAATFEAHIQTDDLIGIHVSSINPLATAVFNQGGAATDNTTGNTSAETPDIGYLVDKDGMIDFPVLGKLHIAGLTVNRVKDTIAQRLDRYLKEPIVNARILNYKITVLGEVKSPAAYLLKSERTSIIDAIGLAGDLTIYGRRENILLIREENGQRKFIRMNLNSTNIFQSPYYYLKQNDVVYVEPSKQKIQGTDTQTMRNLSYVSISLSIIVILASILKK